MLKFGSKNDVTVVHRATIRLLDDTEIIQCDFQPQHKGRFILEYVCKQLNILETDYFGLRYVDHSRQRHWLDLAKTAIKQVKDMDPILFSFRVKFYPPDPFRLKEEITRYQVYQQLKRDLLHGRLYCSPGEAALLAACVVQSELGDYDPEIHEGNYISEHKLLLKQTETIEEKAMDLHQTQLKGFTPEQAETHFLRLASQLDTYAVDPHPVKDHRGSQLYLGINHCGILTFQGSRKTHHFRWPEVQKINYEGKMFIVHLTFNEDLRTKKKHTVGFKCPTGSSCRHVWRCAIEQMLFFTLPRASDAPVVSGGSIFSWGTKFKYTGRTEKEVLEETGPLRKEEPAIQRGNARTSSLRRKASSVPATPSTPSQDLVEIRYSSLPRSCHSAGLDGTGMCESGGVPFSSPYCPDNTLPLLETVSEDQEIHARRNNAVDENDSHASAAGEQIQPVKKLKFAKTTFSKAPPLYSQRIVIGTEELSGKNIDKLVRQKIDSFEKSPKVVRSTALIVKTSKTLANGISSCPNSSTFNSTSNIKLNGNVYLSKDSAPTDLSRGLSSSSGPLLVDHNLQDIAGMRKFQVNPKIDDPAPGRNRINFTDGDSLSNTVGADEADTNDYYFRDSFDHSSSESQLLDATGKPHSRSVTPVPKMQKLQNSKLCLQVQGSGKVSHKRLHVIKIFVPALMLTIVVLCIVTVLIFETDTALFNSMRKTPEMVALRNQCYAPIREFLKSKFGLF
ncbi:FERM domain-containing protein 5 isoform X1 [Neodiprion pinetum]|uniref:FERM domain-containing protein 5 isoform X1 n=1 Tax=Neodiprion fabricii TaxID=2872261 RepID=UPI001ED91CA8|nr:FERM domain-containing protein 5 isoform X1 [Neodiprion fabricii]XP_046490057.1 FERM domain-containing protein 5 isoform X1 [Neodiprion pinetum]XP_046627161.1 FERM domain-containing protein 5 isoform X1 [Neodiprion virginianus]